MRCLDCNRGFCEICLGGGCDCKHNGTTESVGTSEAVSDTKSEGTDSKVALKRIRRTKLDASLRDQQSTGRKRAARLYPLDRTESCEWRLKKGMGGGDRPVDGCVSGLQQARHHGPDKNTLNNDEGNVHRICHSCHNFGTQETIKTTILISH